MLFIKGKNREEINKRLEKNGFLLFFVSDHNSPHTLQTRLFSDQIKDKQLVCIYTHLTKNGYFYITEICWIFNNRLEEWKSTEEDRRRLHKKAIFLPEFEDLI